MYIFAIDNVTSENFNLLYIILCMVTFIKKYVEFYEKDICTCTTSISRPAIELSGHILQIGDNYTLDTCFANMNIRKLLCKMIVYSFDSIILFCCYDFFFFFSSERSHLIDFDIYHNWLMYSDFRHFLIWLCCGVSLYVPFFPFCFYACSVW